MRHLIPAPDCSAMQTPEGQGSKPKPRQTDAPPTPQPAPSAKRSRANAATSASGPPVAPQARASSQAFRMPPEFVGEPRPGPDSVHGEGGAAASQKKIKKKRQALSRSGTHRVSALFVTLTHSHVAARAASIAPSIPPAHGKTSATASQPPSGVPTPAVSRAGSTTGLPGTGQGGSSRAPSTSAATSRAPTPAVRATIPGLPPAAKYPGVMAGQSSKFGMVVLQIDVLTRADRGSP